MVRVAQARPGKSGCGQGGVGCSSRPSARGRGFRKFPPSPARVCGSGSGGTEAPSGPAVEGPGLCGDVSCVAQLCDLRVWWGWATGPGALGGGGPGHRHGGSRHRSLIPGAWRAGHAPQGWGTWGRSSIKPGGLYCRLCWLPAAMAIKAAPPPAAGGPARPPLRPCTMPRHGGLTIPPTPPTIWPGG